MKTTSLSEAELLERYTIELANLSLNGRLELIARLARTVQAETPAPPATPPFENKKVLLDFAGAWQNMPESAEELIAIIEGARTSNFIRESLD